MLVFGPCFCYTVSFLAEEERASIEVIKLFSCSTQLGSKCIMLINVKMPTIVGIFTFINMINTTSKSLKQEKFFFLFFNILVFMS